MRSGVVLTFVTDPLTANVTLSGTATIALSGSCVGDGSCFYDATVSRRSATGTLSTICQMHTWVDSAFLPWPGTFTGAGACSIPGSVAVSANDRIEISISTYYDGSGSLFYGVADTWVEFEQDLFPTACGATPAPQPCVVWSCTSSGWEARPAPAGTACREGAGECDVAEYCDGVSMSCPPDLLAGLYVECRASAGICDVAENCTAYSPVCPEDTLKGPENECRPGAGICDVAEYCTGSSPLCGPNQFEGSTKLCRASAGTCDVEEYCSGASAACPSNAFKSPNDRCREAAGVCDLAENCSGSSAVCPPDQFKDSSTKCRAAAGACDVDEFCLGSGASCPPDALADVGTQCFGNAACGCDASHACVFQSRYVGYCYDGAGNMTARNVKSPGEACAQQACP
jgi:hypothetical protein